MKLIVTGGAGFIGGNFIHYMMNKHPEYKIICLDLLTYAGNLETLAPVMKSRNFQFVKGDIADRDFVYGLFEAETPDVIVNFAAESHKFFFRPTLSVQVYCWMPAENMVFSVIIRYRRMKYMEIYHSIDRTCFSQKAHRFIHQVLILHQKHLQIF